MNRPTLRELECFVAVGEELHFSRAARRLNLSQPPLSRHIRELEERVGRTLLQRTRQRVALTEAGKLFLEEARGVLNRLDRAVFGVSVAGAEMARSLHLGFVGVLLAPDFLGLLQHLRRGLPKTQISLEDLSPSEQLEAIREGKLDGGFLGVAPRRLPAAVDRFNWKRESLRVCLPPEHPLSGKRKIDLADLSNDPWVSVERAAAPDFHRLFMEVCRRAGMQPRVVQEAQRASAVLALVALGTGVAVLTETATQAISSGVVVKPIADDSAYIEHAMVWSRRRARENPALEEALALMKAQNAAVSV